VGKKPGKITTAVLLGALLNIILNYFFIPHYGIYGAGIASVLAYFFIVIYNFYAERKIFHTGYKILSVLIALIFLTITTFLIFILPSNIFVLALKLLLLLFSAALIFLYFRKNGKFKLLLQNSRNKE
jgi:O-antigen/teichoic acid export membrane protein